MIVVFSRVFLPNKQHSAPRTHTHTHHSPFSWFIAINNCRHTANACRRFHQFHQIKRDIIMIICGRDFSYCMLCALGLRFATDSTPSIRERKHKQQYYGERKIEEKKQDQPINNKPNAFGSIKANGINRIKSHKQCTMMHVTSLITIALHVWKKLETVSRKIEIAA